MAGTGKRTVPRATNDPGREALPDSIAPQLAVAVTRPPMRGEWGYEIKFDGYRFRARIDGEYVRLLTRNEQDWTRRLPQQARALKELGLDTAWIDGEMVALNDAGLPDFGLLQHLMGAQKTGDVLYFAFDLLFLNGKDLRGLPLRERRAMLLRLMEAVDSPVLRYSADFPYDADDIVAAAREMNLEGVIGKRLDAPYRSGESDDWVKLKCKKRQEFVLGGYTAGRAGIRALLLGVYEGSRLVFAGSVALTGKERYRIADEKLILAARSDVCPFDHFPRLGKKEVYHWLAPTVVAEVSFQEWTRSNVIRHAVYLGLRSDKPANAVIREVPLPPVEVGEPAPARSFPRAASRVGVGKVAVTHGDRVIDPSTGLTKFDIVQYYASVAPRMLPHVRGRPVTLVRAPEGLSGELFFQKHAEGATLPGVTLPPASLHPNHPPLLTLDTVEAIVSAAQMGVVEMHTWNATQPDLEHPDRLVFDLDPDVKLSWARVAEAATLVRFVLDELGLKSWVKTSGGKGLHVLVPLTPNQEWAGLKAFSHAVSRHLAKVLPGSFSAVSGPKNRVGRIYVDYLRNGKGQSTAAAYSVRARPGLGVSMPIHWEEVSSLSGGDFFSLRSYPLLAEDPWEQYWTMKQVVSEDMVQRLGHTGS